MSQLGKNINYASDETVQPCGGNCGLGCTMGCGAVAASLCKCKKGKSANKGSTYYSHRNSYIAVVRSPTTA